MVRENEIRKAEVTVQMPPTMDAGLVFIGRIHTPIFYLFHENGIFWSARVIRPAVAVGSHLRDQHPRGRDLLDRICYTIPVGRQEGSCRRSTRIACQRLPSRGSSRKKPLMIRKKIFLASSAELKKDREQMRDFYKSQEQRLDC
jgi:hypothetical protein